MQLSKPDTLVRTEAVGGGMIYLAKVSDSYAFESLLPYVRVIERAWNDFELTGVLCVDNIPTVYYREVSQPLTDPELIDLHRRFWNQGVAQTLIVADPKTVRILSGLAEPQKPDASLSGTAALVETLTRLEYIQVVDSLWQAIANGAWYAKHAPHYKADSGVDAYLLANLVALRDLLTKGDTPLSSRMAHALIGRVLFVCYLVDRGIYVLPPRIDAKTLNDALKKQNDEDAIHFLYELFASLKVEFNGSMFDQNLPREKNEIKPFHIQTLRRFLDGQEVLSPQHNLGFWAYDFKLIPVETISAIYEEFLAHEDPESKRATGTFYTPRFLAEMTLDVAIDGRSDWHTLRYLDPCCGSGIFLVTLFNRLATRWLLANPDLENKPEGYLRKVKALTDILVNNLRGVDLNPTACRLACFSLYIAFLDCLSPADIRTFVLKTNNKLPRLLADDVSETGPSYIPVVTKADFLFDDVFQKQSFDCIIGNPPWEGRSAKQIAIHILQRAELFLVNDGEGCLLLPSKIFLNSTTNQFQYDWLGRVTVDRVVQLADYRFVLFEKAKCPSMIVRYRKRTMQDTAHRIAYDTPKFTPTARRRGLVTIGSSEHKWLAQAELHQAAHNNEAQVVWKRRLWGTGRDQRILEYLGALPLLSAVAGGPQEEKRWIKGQGFQPDSSGKSKRPKDSSWKEDDLFISARTKALEVSQHVLEDDCEPLGPRFKKLHRPRDPRIYEAPLVLVSQGFGKVVFSDFSILFQHSLQSIAGPPEDEDLLLFLTVYLRSNLAKYVMFHTAANWGTERDKVHLEELLRLPFPLPEDAPSKNAGEIVRTIAARMREERRAQGNLLKECLRQSRTLTGIDEKQARRRWLRGRQESTDSLQVELEPLIHEYFGLLAPEVMLIEDTVKVSIPSSTPSNPERLDLPTLQPVINSKVPGYERGLALYAETLANTLNTWAAERGSDFRVSPAGGTDEPAGLAMVTLTLDNIASPWVDSGLDGKLSHWLKRGYAACARETATLRSERELLWFDRNQIHIVRPWTLIHWTRTAALNDADLIYGEISQARRIANA